ncbi:probable calcium-binding CML36 [Olea europaea subsp. europaea]|uniref:Probable calcium-binding CML36 n=1 Tax=Olea europaea subsp. europaea TaxID=158383 RepID=A0A8S0TWC3_OLEEU|nr:probable calcium-binding CML36 [Olea europaea subsp. europaea]
MIDREGTGKVKKEELKTLLSSIGAEPASQEELTMMLNEVDGRISLEEFYTIGSAFGPKALEAELRETFDFFDSDRDG